jgi:heptosyltransferase-1
MGDILHALPAVTALRALLPDCQMGWVVEPQWRALLQAANTPTLRGLHMPVVDHLHVASVKRWARAPLHRKTMEEIAGLRRELRAMHYDICVDLQGALRSAWIGRMARTARMIGEDSPREWAARWLFTERVRTQGVHVVEQCREVVSAVLHRPVPAMPAALPHDPEAEQTCQQWLEGRKIKRFVLINPGAGWGAKCWPADRYGRVARELARLGLATVVNAGPGEEELAQQVCAASDGCAVPMMGSIGELVACTRRAALFVGGDTGPLHLAAALQRPVVGIFGPTDPARNGPFETRACVLRHPESKRDHARRKEPEAGLLTFQVDDVVQAIQQVLQEAETGE